MSFDGEERLCAMLGMTEASYEFVFFGVFGG